MRTNRSAPHGVGLAKYAATLFKTSRSCELLFVRFAPSLARDGGNWITGDFLLPAP
jgi:hypothetical protein